MTALPGIYTHQVWNSSFSKIDAQEHTHTCTVAGTHGFINLLHTHTLAFIWRHTHSLLVQPSVLQTHTPLQQLSRSHQTQSMSIMKSRVCVCGSVNVCLWSCQTLPTSATNNSREVQTECPCGGKCTWAASLWSIHDQKLLTDNCRGSITDVKIWAQVMLQ